jgi:hypothetical protein
LAAIAGAFVTIPATIILARLEIHIPTKR